MRAALLTGFGAILGLGASGTNANIICDTKQALDVTAIGKAGDLQATINSCIDRVCTTGLKAGKTGGFFTDRCGQVLLSITHIEDALPPSEVEDCIAHFSDIVDQCIATESVRGGTVLTADALYEAYVVSQEREIIQERGFPSEKDGKSVVKVRRVGVPLEARQSKSKNKPKSASKPVPAAKPKSTASPTPKSKPASKPKSTPTASPTPKPNPSKPQQKCNGQKDTNGKDGKKTIRDTLDDFLPQALRRAPPPPQDEASCTLPDVVHYKKSEYERGKVWAYYFDSSAGWQNSVAEVRAKPVLTSMNADGKFNVVVMKTAQSYCVGDPGGRTDPYNLAVQSVKAGDKCLITNGNYFVMGGAQNLEFHAGGPVVENLRSYNHFAVGFTTSTSKQVDVPVDHAQYYETFMGDDGSSLMCGPSLKEPLDLTRPELQYWCKKTHATTEHAIPHPERSTGLVQTVYSQIPGGLATSNQPNERLVTVILKNDLKLVFTYTSRRSRGVNVNQMRSVVEAFLASFLKADIKTDTKQVLNLDGGGSIFVAWVKNKQWNIIAAGNLNGERTPPGWRPRMVTTMIKHVLG